MIIVLVIVNRGKKMKFNFMKKKRAISPVVATVLLISLVVAASAIVFTLVVPMLKGSSDIEILSTQWFDTDGDSVADIVYITVQNSGTAEAIITGVNITLLNDIHNTTLTLQNVDIEQDIPYTVSISARADLIVRFNSTDDISYGSNVFRVSLTFGDNNVAFASENLKHTDLIEDLSLTVINPINNSWFSGVIDPQVVKTGGFLPTAVKYTLYYPNGTSVAGYRDVLHTVNIDTNVTAIPDDHGYILSFFTSDVLGSLTRTNITINVDNYYPTVALQLNGSSFNQNEGIDIAWTVTGIDEIAGDSPLISQILTLTATGYDGKTLYSDDGSTALEGVQISPYDLPGSETLYLHENTYTITIYVKDSAGNTKANGKDFDLVDDIHPETYFVTPANNDTALSDIVLFEIYAKDTSGIDTQTIYLTFLSTTGGTDYPFTISDLSCYYDENNFMWIIYFSTYLVENDNYYVKVDVFDTAGNGNTSKHYNDVDNTFLGINHIIADEIDGPGGYALLSFDLTNKANSSIKVITISFSWTYDKISFIHTVYDFTDTWLASPGPYNKDIGYPVNNGDGIIIEPGDLSYKRLNIGFTMSPGGKIFDAGKITVMFNIENIGWETHDIYI